MPRNTMPNFPLSCNHNNLLETKDQFLPIANISRIMKKSLPPNAKISKEAKEIVQECVSEFITFVTGEASDKCQKEKRKTINGDDLLWAMTTLGFENYVGLLKDYLNKYREIEEDRSSISSFVNDRENGLKINGDYHCGEGINEKSNKGFVSYGEREMESNLHHGVEWYG